jgi:hypothetical protein
MNLIYTRPYFTCLLKVKCILKCKLYYNCHNSGHYLSSCLYLKHFVGALCYVGFINLNGVVAGVRRQRLSVVS